MAIVRGSRVFVMGFIPAMLEIYDVNGPFYTPLRSVCKATDLR